MICRSRALWGAVSCALASVLPSNARATVPMQIGFLWHMHQPTYYPGEDIVQTDANHRFSYSVTDIHNQRFGPYTTWPRDAIQAGLSLPNLGAQVSFSGSLMDNLNTLQAAGVNGGMWNNWTAGYKQARAWTTAEGNPRLDLVGFGYEHPLMPLLDVRDMRMQIELHKTMLQQTFGSNVPYSKGFFPAETAFSERMIPALAAEGIDWTIVDNIHFDRATQNYPQTNNSGLFAPNKADQINPDPVSSGGAWIQLNNLWAPSKVSAPFSYRPHNVQYVDPNSGAVTKIVAVPGARYEGNEDGRGGFGALQYQTVMDQYRQYNTDPAHPMFVLLHHDGDNYGGGSDSYYHNNFQSMVNWATNNANYNVTTVQDYLKKYPVATSDVIHVENGSWAGADNGDPEFKKWLGDPNSSGWSPDRNSWAVLTAAKNRVFTADDIAPVSSLTNVINGTGSASEKAWHYLVQSEASDHWYWDGTEVWDSNVTRGSNLAVAQADTVIRSYTGTEHTPPSVFVPQRDSYNPGAYEFGATPEPSDFKIWTYAYDVSGLNRVTLKWRTDLDGENPQASTQNETYAGGSEVGAWNSVSMTSSDMSPPSNILTPTYRALQYGAMIQGQSNKLIDYYVEAVDGNGNLTKTDIQHVWVGGSTGTGTGTSSFVMDGALDADAKQIASNNGMHLYYSMHGGKLYVATNGAGAGNDHFIYLAKNPGAMVSANWAKAGQVAQWDAYLADENNNGWSGWFDASGAVQNATTHNTGVLEGTIDLAGEFGSLPADLYLAVGVFETADGGKLLPAYQLPGSLDSDTNLQANEYLHLQLPQGWVLGGSGSWNNSWNWADAVPNAVGASARLLNTIASASTITVDSPVTIGQMTLDSSYGYTVAGPGTLTFDVANGAASINVVSGNHTISAPIALNDDLIVNVAQSGTSLVVTTTLNAPGKTLTKSGGGAVQLNAIKVGAMNVTGGLVQIAARAAANDPSGTSVVNALSIASGAALDLTNNSMVIDYSGAVGNLLDQTRLMLKNGQLLTSSADPSQRLGFADNAVSGLSTFSGQSVDSTSILILFTYAGDASLDGKVDVTDLGRLATSWQSAGVWSNGDFNYDGVIDVSDLGLLATNWQAGTTGAGPTFAEAMAQVGLRGTSVPEPTMAMVVTPMLAGLRSRRRAASISPIAR